MFNNPYNLRNKVPINETDNQEVGLNNTNKPATTNNQATTTLLTTSNNTDTTSNTEMNKDNSESFLLFDDSSRSDFLGFEEDSASPENRNTTSAAIMNRSSDREQGERDPMEQPPIRECSRPAVTNIGFHRDGEQSHRAEQLSPDEISSTLTHQATALTRHTPVESQTNVVSPADTGNAIVNPPSDLLEQIALLMNTNFQQLGTKFNQLETKLDTRFDILQSKTDQTNERFEIFSKQIDIKFVEVNTKCDNLIQEVNDLKSTQSEQSLKINSMELKIETKVNNQIKDIREDLIKDLELQHDTIQETIKTNNHSLIKAVDDKLINHTQICQVKIDENKKEILNQILPISQQQTKQISELNVLFSQNDNRLEVVEQQIGQQNYNQPNVYVTCNGGNNHSLDTNPPKFYGRALNPKEFLNKLKRFYDRSAKQKNLTNNLEHLHDTIEQCLDQHALKWFELSKNKIDNWTDFENLFINKYWNREIQRGIKQRIEIERYRPGGKLSRAEYFIERVLLLRSITPPLSDEEITNILAEHFSELIQDARHVQNVNSVTGFELLLQREDLKDAHRQSQTSHRRIESTSPQNNNNQNHNYQNYNQSYKGPNNQSKQSPRNYQNNNNKNYQQRPSTPPHYQRDYNQRPDFKNNYYPNNYSHRTSDRQQNYNTRRDDRSYPSKEQQQVCTAIIERTPSPNEINSPTVPNNLNG